MDDYSNRPNLTNGHNLGQHSTRPDTSKRTDTSVSGRSTDLGYLAPARINALDRKDSSISESGSAPDSLLDLYGERKNSNSDTYNYDDDPERSRWIHRDKLARIESQELQAAGIILSTPRASSRSSRRETSRDLQGNGLRSEQAGQKRQRMESFPSEEEIPESNQWDLRTPEEAAGDQGDLYQDVSGGVRGVSRIPICKTSPIPIPFEHLERETPMQRKQSGIWGEEEAAVAISNPKSRGRSSSVKLLQEASATPTPARRIASENPTSQTKKIVKKGATPAVRTTSNSRPKTRSGTITGEPPAVQRPPTRSGDLTATKRPEGDPPWLATMYKPDPRLPPDQQLLPTVAKRLQQEQWEKEGKFGNAYDTAFRPINDDQFHKQPEAPETPEVDQEKEGVVREWPLRGPKSPTTSTDQPETGPEHITVPQATPPVTSQDMSMSAPISAPLQLEESPEDANNRGCACCIVM